MSVNWKCRVFGHKLRPLKGGPLSDGSFLDVRNIGVCEREGTLHKLDPGAAHYKFLPQSCHKADGEVG